MFGSGSKRLHTIALCAWAICALHAPAAAQTSCIDGTCEPAADLKVRVGYSQFPPFSRTSPTGVAEGYSIDLVRLLLEPQGYAITFVPYDNPAEMLEGIGRGEIELTSLLADNPARREVGTFTDFIASFDIGVFVADDTPLPRSLEDLEGLRIGAAEGSFGFRFLADIDNVSVIPYSSGVDTLLPLLTGEVDAIVNSVESFRHLANRAAVGHRISVTGIVLRETPVALLAAPDETAIVADLNSAIATAMRSGDLARLYDTWFAAKAAPVTLREQYVVGAALFVAFCALAYWARLHLIVLRRAKRMEARSQLFIEALDATGLSFAIFDADMRPTHWNEAFKQSYPNQLPQMQKGEPMEAIMTASYMKGSEGKPMDEPAAKALASERVGLLQAGAELTSLYATVTGQSHRRKTKRLPNGQYVTIAADVTELIDAQKNLETAHRELELANQKLVEFNRLAAHDLMAPLRNVRNLHSWIRDDIEDMGVNLDAETIENLESIDTLLDRQSKMIEDLLAFSSVDAPQSPEDFQPADRYPAILDLVNVLPGFKVVLPEQTPAIHADPIAFDIVLRNLIGNAIKHHDRTSGTVTVSARPEGDRCIFKVHDDGPGIPESAAEKIFEPFMRLKSRDDGAGSGLGLAFIKSRVVEWGGSVKAVSRDGERGTTFRFDVPLAFQNRARRPFVGRVIGSMVGYSNASKTKSA